MRPVPDKLFLVVGAAGLLNAALGVGIIAVGASVPGTVLAGFGVLSVLGAWWLQQVMRKHPEQAGSVRGDA
jgi:hypothetical protein